MLFLPVAVFSQIKESDSGKDLLAGKSAYISNDKVEIKIHGKDNQDQNYRAFEINRDVTYHILNGYGLNMFDNYSLPADFDPTFIPHGPTVKNLGNYYSAYKIESFKVIVKRKGKKPFTPKFKKRIKSIESFNLDYLYNYAQNVYTFTDLMIGDEVRIQYSVTIPFRENYSRFASYRIFFNDSLPKLKCDLTLINHETLDLELYQFNGAKATKDYTTDKIRYRNWHYENLPGCINEPGSKPYMELPYLSWVINYYKYYIHNSNDLKSVPHYAVISSVREKGLGNILTSIGIGSKTKEFAAFTSTYEKLTDGLNKDHTLVNTIHNHITEVFDYQNDIEYYRRNDTRGERLGEFFSSNILRDASRYILYYAILVKSGLQTYSSYIIDNRFGEVSDQYFLPNFDDDHLLSVFFGENLTDYFLPKRHKFGWYYNELPFYYENSKVRQVHVTDYAVSKSSIKELFRTGQTNSSDPKTNIRKHDYKVTVDKDADLLLFSGSCDLIGQYSTLCRGAHMNGYKDPTVNRLYNKSLNELIPDCENKINLATGVSHLPPFIARFESTFSSTGKVKKEVEGNSIDLKNFFPYVIPQFSSAQKRFMTYYPDFRGTDTFAYEFQFTHPVELKDEKHISIDNDFGKFSFEVKQNSPLTVLVTSEYSVKIERLEAEDFNKAIEIFRAIDEIKNYKLKVK